MKPLKTALLAAIVMALLLPSCSIEKRKYRKGYYIDLGVMAPNTTDNNATNTPPAVPPTNDEISAMEQGTTREYWIHVVVGPRHDKKAVQARHKPPFTK